MLILYILIFASIVLLIFPPKKINSIYGYRTKRSMQNQTKWDFGQKYSAKMLCTFSVLALVIMEVLRWMPLELSGPGRRWMGLILGLLVIAFTIFLTEKKLKEIN